MQEWPLSFARSLLSCLRTIFEEKPGLVGLLAGAGSLDQANFPYLKLYGDVDDESILGKLKSYILGISAYNKLKGMTYVGVGGRSINIDTTVADPALWMKKFGIDVDSVDQMENSFGVLKLYRKKKPEVLNKAIEYLMAHTKGV